MSACLGRYHLVRSLRPFILGGCYYHSSPHSRRVANTTHILWKRKQRLSEVTCHEGAWLTQISGVIAPECNIFATSLLNNLSSSDSVIGGKKWIPTPQSEGGTAVRQDTSQDVESLTPLSPLGSFCAPAPFGQLPHQSQEEAHGHGRWKLQGP